ncbi:MAG: hypothetical protein P4L98_01530, partial [Ancalomicrobiaceae bacterium]|nr:hypothetical protein [Ancalomicrobiaceae bacterium]
MSTREIAGLALYCSRWPVHPGDVSSAILRTPIYWGDLNRYDPAQTAATLSLPALILQGDRDCQVRLADVVRFRAALAGHANAEIHVMPTLNHLFMPGRGASTPAEFEIAGHVNVAAIDLISDF